MTQHRLSRVQLVNWGTFDGARSFGVPRRGLLLTGPSGAGKSSVLDAMASILVRPKKLKFNAAAQGTETGDRERSLVTYVLGAYKRETDAETGEVGTAFLRKGPTWSGVALTFDDGHGEVTTLLRLFYLRGGTTSGDDLKSMFVMAPEAVDLLSLQSYAKDGIENRRLGQAFPRWDVYGAEAYTGFAAKFRRRLGLGSEQAQLLLHKTQSAKNLTNLDSLFRDFMLDEPDTFDLADETVAQFGELSSAHAAVVDARRQVEALTPLRQLGDRLADAVTALEGVAAEEAHLGGWLTARNLADAEHQLGEQRPKLAGFDAELMAAEQEWKARDDERVEAQRALDGSAGAELGTLEELIDTLTGELASKASRIAALADAASEVGLQVPRSVADSEAFRAELATRASEFEAEDRGRRDALYDALDGRGVAKRGRDDVRSALESLRRHGSNLDPRLLAARQLLAERLQVAPSTLPFVGELLQVRADESEWTGAIERVLGSFARTLVVPDRHYLAASEIIDAQFLGTRLVYERVVADVAASASAQRGAASLVDKLELADSPHAGWLADRLQRRFDYTCVERSADLRQHDKAVTRAGQIKHSTSLHEKDDRRRLDDRGSWVLGFSTAAKEADLERQLRAAEAAHELAERKVEALERDDSDRQARRTALAQLERVDWHEFDVAEIEKKLKIAREKRDQLRRDNSDVPDLEGALAKAKDAVGRAEDVRRQVAAKRDKLQQRVQSLEELAEKLRRELVGTSPVPGDVAERLDRLASDIGAAAERLEIEVREALARRRREAERRRVDLSGHITRQMARYIQQWPAQAADWADEVEYLPEYLERLATLERDGLPTFEKRFFDLLQNQARTNIGQLSNQIRGARREIRTRVDDVNKSLRLTQFSPGGHLQIEVKERALPEVEQFLATLNAIISGSISDVLASDTPEDRAAAEARFELMKGILVRLGSPDPVDKAWREKCLDTRQHVQFQARVLDADQNQLDVFTGSGGRSGGERQKLVTFCLAAALRFQLAPAGRSEPAYALVVIDEAFDKADHTFTQAGLEVFKRFGFQLFLATPMKMLQTIDDYVGGVVMVTNDSGRHSQVQELPFDADDEAEDPSDDQLQEALL